MSLSDKKIGWYLVKEVVERELQDQPDIASKLLSAISREWSKREKYVLGLEFSGKIRGPNNVDI